MDVVAAVAALDDLVRRLSSPGATCTASELAAIRDSLTDGVEAVADVPTQVEAVAVAQPEPVAVADEPAVAQPEAEQLVVSPGLA